MTCSCGLDVIQTGRLQQLCSSPASRAHCRLAEQSDLPAVHGRQVDWRHLQQSEPHQPAVSNSSLALDILPDTSCSNFPFVVCIPQVMSGNGLAFHKQSPTEIACILAQLDAKATGEEIRAGLSAHACTFLCGALVLERDVCSQLHASASADCCCSCTHSQNGGRLQLFGSAGNPVLLVVC